MNDLIIEKDQQEAFELTYKMLDVQSKIKEFEYDLMFKELSNVIDYLIDRDDLYTLNQRIGAFHIKGNNIYTKYLFYILNRNKQLLQFDNGIDQTNLRKDDILNIMIPLPSLSEQSRIVSILDTFEASIQNLEAQLKERGKQYEYYREKLLTFE